MLGEGGPQKGGNPQDTVFHIDQSTNAVVHDHIGGVQVTEKHPSIVEDLQALRQAKTGATFSNGLFRNCLSMCPGACVRVRVRAHSCVPPGSDGHTS